MRLIITRPKADAEVLAPRLEAMGHKALMCPLISIRQRSGLTLPNVKLQAVCASSANGLAAALEWTRLIALPFYAVGPQSAEAARKRGFRHVNVAESGNLNGLAAMIASRMLPQLGALLYLSGSEVSGDLAALLGPHGIAVERLVVYDAMSVEPANLNASVALADGVLLYSPRAARLWAKATAGIDVGAIRHFCLSPNVAAQLPQSVPISVSQTPDESGMMALLDWKSEAE